MISQVEYLKKQSMPSSQTKLPVLSVIVLTKDSENFLEECLTSLQKQTFKDFEVLIVDGKSKDKTKLIADKFCRNDSRFKWLTQPGRGIGDAAQFGLLQAQGEWVARLDADDVALPDRFDLQMNEFKKDPSLVFCGSWMEFIDTQGNKMGLRKYPVEHSDILKALQIYNPLPNPASMFSKSLALKVGGYDPRVVCTEDLELFYRMLPHGKFKNIPKVLTLYRQHPQSHKSTKARETLVQTVKFRIRAYRQKALKVSFTGVFATLGQALLILVPEKITLWLFYNFFSRKK